MALFVSASVAEAQIYDGVKLTESSVEGIVGVVQPGDVLVIGEIHDSEVHHKNQVQLLQVLGERFPVINVGMEFFHYTDQSFLDSYLKDQLSEGDFLRSIGWGGIPFEFYRDQVRFPLTTGGWTYGLNIPRAITRKVSQKGLASLTPEERRLMPPDFELGNDQYRERFSEVMKDHVSPEALERYFTSQSLWDDTMAWRATQLMQEQPDSVLVILVGEFHVAWFGGLPDRLRHRGLNQLLVISQSRDPDDVSVHPVYGPRADFIWISD